MEKALTRAGLNCRAFDSGDAWLTLESETPMVVVISNARHGRYRLAV